MTTVARLGSMILVARVVVDVLIRTPKTMP